MCGLLRFDFGCFLCWKMRGGGSWVFWWVFFFPKLSNLSERTRSSYQRVWHVLMEAVVPSFSLIFTKPACLPLCSPLLLQPNASSASQQNHLVSSLPAAKGLVEVRSSAQRISLMKKIRNGNYPNWKECLAGDHVPNSSSHFSWSLEALKRKSFFYLNILVISHLLIFEQLSLPTNKVLMKAMDPVFFPPL